MLLNRADAVVTVSKTTKRLVLEHKLTKRPVSVVTNAAERPDTALLNRALARTAPSRRSLVYMGSFMPYKNVETLVRAAALLPDYELHLMSKVTEAERTRLQNIAPQATLIFHDGASDAEYHEALVEATALVTASFDEGFGIPLVESMELGTPVVVSDIPIFREIGGDSALYVDPRSPDSLASAVRSLEAPGQWRDRSSRSVIESARYTWQASAVHLLTVLTATVGRSPRS
jgi:glycosyltransferase involved in cell wall biosynthesis